MRIFKGSSITLELPVHVCGAGNFSIEKVVIYTTDPDNAVEFRNHMLIDETLHVYVNADSLNILDEGVINYIVEGDNIHIERMSSYFLKTPKDYTAVSMELEKREVTVTTNNSTTTITKNPTYLGMEEVKVHTEIPMEENILIELTENDTYVDIEPSEGYEGIKSGKVGVNIPIQDRSETYTDNGTYEVIPDYGLMSHVEVIVDVPLEYGKDMYVTTNNTAVEIEPSSGYKGVRQGKVYVEIPTQDEKTVNIVKNGTTEVLPDEGYHYIRKVNINTDVTLNSTPIGPSQISFYGSTWEEFDMSPYDWKYVYNWSGMFTDCNNLKRIHNFPQDAKAYGATSYMFYSCGELEEAPYFDTKYIGDFGYMFDACSNLTTIPQYDMSNALSIQGMLSGCYKLTSLPQFYCPKLKDGEMFRTYGSYDSLTDIGGWREIRCNLNLRTLRKLTPQSISNVIEGLYDFEYWAEEPDSTQGTLTLATSLSSVVTEEMMAKATSKRWNIIF